MANSNEYMKNYMMNRRAKRRSELRTMLGGECKRCGSTSNLEFDHIDPKTKTFTIGTNIDRSWDSLLREASKCQLLCKDCHIVKTSVEQSVDHGGGTTGKGRCLCHLCRSKKSEYMRSYNRPSRR